MEEQQTKIGKLKAFVRESRRVLKVTRKPDMPEFKTIVKVSAIGMAVIGLLGFLIRIMKELMFR